MIKNKLLLCLILFILVIFPSEHYINAESASEPDLVSSLFDLNEQGYFTLAFSKTIDMTAPLKYSPLTEFLMQMMADDAKATLASFQKVSDIYDSASLTFYPDGRAWFTYKFTDAAYNAFKSVDSRQKQSVNVVSNSYKVDSEKGTVAITKDVIFEINIEDETLSRTSSVVLNEVFSVEAEVVEPLIEEQPVTAFTVMKDISYGTDESDQRTKMDVYVPKNRDTSKNNGAFLVIYGGGWTSGSKEEMESVAEPFASAGYVTVAINMRNVFVNETTQKTEVTVYDMLNNVHDSIKKLKELSDEHGWNIKEIALFGGSSGANIAMNYAYSRGSNMENFDTSVIVPVKFVTEVVGPVDMHESAWYGDENWPDRSVMTVPGAGPLYAMLLTGAVNNPNLTEEDKEYYIKSMSPVHYVQTNGGIPTVMGYSKVDYIQNPNNGKALKGHLDNKNIRNDLFTFPKSIHGYYADPEEAKMFFDKSLEYAEQYFNGTTAIVDLTVKSSTSSTVTLGWPAAARGATKLLIEQSPAGKNLWTTSAAGTIATDATSAIVIGLAQGTAYDFRLVVTGGANTGNSNSVSAMTNSVVPETPVNLPSSGSNVVVAGDSDLVKPGNTTTLGTIITTERNGQSVATIKLEQKRVEDLLATAEQGAVITIPMTMTSDAAAVELTGQTIVALGNKNAVLELRTDRARYKIPAQQIIRALSDPNVDFSNKDLKNVTIQVEIANPGKDSMTILENSANTGKFTILGSPAEFRIRALHEDKTIEITSFNTYVEHFIAIPDNVDSKSLTTGIVVEPNGTVRHVPTKIVVMDGKYYAQINSLNSGVYSIVSHQIMYSEMSNHWAKEAVNDMGSRMVLDETINDQFAPDQEITRAEFVAILTRGLGLKNDGGHFPFADVIESDEDYHEIQTAYAFGFITGFNDGLFRPNVKITREEAMIIISKSMAITGLKKKLAELPAKTMLNPFADAEKVSKWAQGAVMDCLNAGIIMGRDNSVLAPQAPITKAEAAAIVRRLLQKSDLI
ncbi:hypothetical protein E2R58_09385 [Paenibacillus amylolyticus]|uniref:S-layer homology domain-containing protein n=1 Tax=Paenibacillus amylolyticus TaxID=1451 RepID=UPI001059CA40|nr:S-layer homology domain-containing protein [Paenibacillus amylolyticus]TDL69363.1 hypothetical protein E2R58_09385 [Paenibacillus amylolyticus]